jgi:hypothetical protein
MAAVNEQIAAYCSFCKQIRPVLQGYRDWQWAWTQCLLCKQITVGYRTGYWQGEPIESLPYPQYPQGAA